MPEGDKFERAIQPGWRSAFRSIREGNMSTEEICDKFTKTLADDLRKTGGIPGEDSLSRVIQWGISDSSTGPFGAIDDIVKEQEGHPNTKIAAGVAKSMMVQQPDGSALDEAETRKALLEKTCLAIIENKLLSKAEYPLVSEGRFESVEDFRNWQDRQEQAIQGNIEKIVDQLIASPDAKKLRAPRRKSPRKSTSALLEDNLL